WQAAWKRGYGYVGVGAFNMVRAAVYRALGGHTALRMEVADDVKLGKLIKRRGYRQLMAGAGSLIRVRWVVGLRGVVHGLEKNAFAGVGYSWTAVLVSSLMLLLGTVWPFAGMLVGPPLARLLCLGAVLSMPGAALVMRRSGISPLYALAWPLAAVLFAFILVRSAVLTQRQGGIYWRGTF